MHSFCRKVHPPGDRHHLCIAACFSFRVSLLYQAHPRRHLQCQFRHCSLFPFADHNLDLHWNNPGRRV